MGASHNPWQWASLTMVKLCQSFPRPVSVPNHGRRVPAITQASHNPGQWASPRPWWKGVSHNPGQWASLTMVKGCQPLPRSVSIPDHDGRVPAITQDSHTDYGSYCLLWLKINSNSSDISLIGIIYEVGSYIITSNCKHFSHCSYWKCLLKLMTSPSKSFVVAINFGNYRRMLNNERDTEMLIFSSNLCRA